MAASRLGLKGMEMEIIAWKVKMFNLNRFYKEINGGKELAGKAKGVLVLRA